MNRQKHLQKRRLSPPDFSPRVTRLLTFGLLLLASIGLLALCLLIGTYNFSFSRFSAYFDQPIIFLMNFIPMALLLLFLYALTNRAWIAWLVDALFFLLLFFVNYFKVALRGEPFVADDLLIAGEGLGILKEYTLQIPTGLWLSLLFVAIGTVVLARYARARVPKKRWWLRVLVALACVAFGAFAWKQWYTDATLYRSTRLKIQHTFSAFRDEEVTAAGGLVWSFLRSVDEAFPEAPEGYDEAEVEETLAQHPDAAIPEDKKVNVVVTMLESYSDLSELGLQFTVDPYAELHKLQQECFSGTLVSDSIGGGTINAERAFLTGFAYRQPDYRRDTASFVRYFSENGYVTTGYHPGVGSFYSRNSINRRLGFDSYWFYENHFHDIIPKSAYYNTTPYATDDAFFANLRENYLQRDTATPYFSFSVTYQGHSPYDDTALRGGEYVSHDGISDEAYYTVNNYLDSVAETGKALASYVDAFRDDEEPVVLVFFGDHKPTLGSSNAYYTELGLLKGLSSAQSRLALYSTPYLIWANDAAKEILGTGFAGKGETISPCYLMSVLFDCCGWEGSSWLQCQRELRQSLPVLHYRSYLLIDGNLTTSYTPEAEQAYTKFACLEYYIREQAPQ